MIDFSESWFTWFYAASWQIALLVCLISLITFLLRSASPKLRYGLWLLVLLKAVLPPTLGVFWGVGNWGVSPVIEMARQAPQANNSNAENMILVSEAGEVLPEQSETRPGAVSFSWQISLLLVWGAGCCIFLGFVAWGYWRVAHSTRAMCRLEEGAARVELEKLALRFSLSRVPELYVTEQPMSPMLFGVLRPKIILPKTILDGLNSHELQMVITHELVHWRRRDTWVGWLQVFVQGIFWFHPLVWWANARIRHERECACDEAVLREEQCDRDGYGETIVQVLTAVRGKSVVMTNMVGIFERGSLLQNRLEEIMSFDPTERRFGWLSRALLVSVALVLLPMAAPGVQAELAEGSVALAEPNEKEVQKTSTTAMSGRAKRNWPQMESSNPKIGATDVDPGLNEIRVTFDQDMDLKSFSWTGGPPFFPEKRPGNGPMWIDSRTCVLPVSLKKGTFYRVGINSSSHQNFKSALGVPAATTAIYFTTKGATRTLTNRLQVPKIVKIIPANGSSEVDPDLKRIRVKFNMSMNTAQYSWVGGGSTFPKIPDGAVPKWSSDGKTCTLPVQLEPGKQYELGLNSVFQKNFTSKWGVPLQQVKYSMETSSRSDVPIHGKIPKIETMLPVNGSRDVDPGLNKIVVTFDRAMAGSFSWTGGGPQFPTIPKGKKPFWSKDKKTCTLPVQLKPDWDYRLGLNSLSFKNFASADGVPLVPVVYEFRTSSGNNEP